MMICRSQWLAEGPGPLVVPGPLADIQDKPWVVQQCAVHIAADQSTQQELLQYGVQVTGQYCQPSDMAAAAAPGMPHTRTRHACVNLNNMLHVRCCHHIVWLTGSRRSCSAVGMPGLYFATATARLVVLLLHLLLLRLSLLSSPVLLELLQSNALVNSIGPSDIPHSVCL